VIAETGNQGKLQVPSPLALGAGNSLTQGNE